MSEESLALAKEKLRIAFERWDSFRKTQICPECFGIGREEDWETGEEAWVCERCNGRGELS